MTDQQQPTPGQPASLAQEYEDWVQQLVVAHREQRAEVDSLRQQLAAAQAERERLQATWDTTKQDRNSLADEVVALLNDRAFLRVQCEATAEECGLLKTENEAMRGVVEAVRPWSYWPLDYVSESVWAAFRAALDAASTGQPKEQVLWPEALVAFRSRFRGSADLSTFTQFGFFEAGYVAGRHAEHVRTGRWETDCTACGGGRANAAREGNG